MSQSDSLEAIKDSVSASSMKYANGTDLVHDQMLALAQVGNVSLGQVMDTARCCHDDVNGLGEPHNIILEVGASC